MKLLQSKQISKEAGNQYLKKNPNHIYANQVYLISFKS